jgi:transposase-like protein
MEGAKFLAQVLSDISSRGVRDVFVFRLDGLTGNTNIQLYLVHMMRQSFAVVPDKDRKTVSADLKSELSSYRAGQISSKKQLPSVP